MDPPGFFPLIVRGGRGVSARHDGATLVVQFRKARSGAGEPSSFNRLPPGSAAWMDRPLNDAEPFVLRQSMDASDAEEVMAVLRNDARFWMFLCANTNSGHFNVHRSEPAFAQVIID